MLCTVFRTRQGVIRLLTVFNHVVQAFTKATLTKCALYDVNRDGGSGLLVQMKLTVRNRVNSLIIYSQQRDRVLLRHCRRVNNARNRKEDLSYDIEISTVNLTSLNLTRLSNILIFNITYLSYSLLLLIVRRRFRMYQTSRHFNRTFKGTGK